MRGASARPLRARWVSLWLLGLVSCALDREGGGEENTSAAGSSGRGASSGAGFGGLAGSSGRSGAAGQSGISDAAPDVSMGPAGGSAGANAGTGGGGTGGIAGGGNGGAVGGGNAGSGAVTADGMAGLSGKSGSAGASGVAGMDGSAAGDSGTTRPGVGIVRCGASQICDTLQNEYCCAGNSTPQCVTAEMNCGTAIRCDGNEDCPGQVCCGRRGSAGYQIFECASSCAGANDTPIGCTGRHNCPAGQVCCGTVVGDFTPSAHYSLLECVSSCPVTDGGTNKYALCTSNVECAPTTACQSSVHLPSPLTVCKYL